jgi:hypothetical protein
MKKIYTILALVILSLGAFAQVPQKMSYQAVVRNASDALVVSTTVGMQISILQGSSTGMAVYVETQTPTTNANGLVSLEIGSGTVVSGTFNTIDWAAGPYFIKTETDPTGGTTYTITGTSQLMSVPFALHANVADSVVGGVGIQDLAAVLTEGDDAGGNNVVNVGVLAIGTISPNAGAALEINSTTGALLLPRMTTSQRDAISPEFGMMIYNTSLHTGQLYTGPSVTAEQPDGNPFEGVSMGQSFIASKTGYLSTISLMSSTVQTGTLNIYEGEGTTGGILSSQSATVNGGFIFTDIVLSAPLYVIAGGTYTIITDLTLRGSFDQASYAGGTAYQSGTPFTFLGGGDIAFKITMSGSVWTDF